MFHHSKPLQADTAPIKQRIEKENKTCALHRQTPKKRGFALPRPSLGNCVSLLLALVNRCGEQCYVSSETTAQLAWHFNSRPLQMLPPSKETHANIGEAAVV